MSLFRQAKGQKENSRKNERAWIRMLFREAYLLARDFLIALSFFAFVVYFLIQPFKVEGTSMLPSLKNHGKILVNKIPFRFYEIHRGDIVVFEYPDSARRSFIKRVIGLPGDSVSIRDGIVRINGCQLNEPYVREEFRGHDNMSDVHVTKGHYFVLGDCRTLSSDSRTWGLVPAQAICGKAFFTYWPWGEIGQIR